MKRKQKKSSVDYTEAMLPQTRKALFWDIVHLHWQTLLTLGFVLLLFAIPLVLSTLARDVYIPRLVRAAESAAADMPQDGMQAVLLYFELGRSIVNILFLMLFAVGLSGVLRVLRQYAWLENVHAPTDFARGLRDNCKQLLALALLGGLVCTLCLLVLSFSTAYRSGLAASISLIPIGISLLLGLPVLAIAVVMVPVYSNTLAAHLKNAFYVYTHAPFRVLLALLCGSLLWVPTLIPNLYFHLFGGIVVVILLPFFLLAWTLFCYGLFDQWINPACCPELIGRGIRHDST